MKIKILTAIGYNTKFSTALLLTFFIISCSKYDILPDGNEVLTKIEIFDPSNQFSIAIEYKYDSSGKIIEIASPLNPSSDIQTFLYDGSGKIKSNTISNNLIGNQYKYDYLVDLNGRIIKAMGTSYRPNIFFDNHTYTYDNHGRLVIDSSFNPSGSLHSYVNFEYDNRNNVIAYQHYINNGTSVVKLHSAIFEYDNKRSPYSKIGQTLYTSLGGSGVCYFYLSKNNPIRATINNSVITPGGKFIHQYYPNSLLKSSTVNVSNSMMTTFYYN